MRGFQLGAGPAGLPLMQVVLVDRGRSRRRGVAVRLMARRWLHLRAAANLVDVELAALDAVGLLEGNG